MRKRILYLDYIRILAMFLVVACHNFGNTSEVSPVIISILSYLEMPCIGLFCAVSGALLLPVQTSPHDFLKKRCKKVIIPTVFWSVVYMILAHSFTLKNFVSMFFYPEGSGILWFVYLIVELYLVSPVISPWLQKTDKKTIQLYLLIWVVTLFYPILGNWIQISTTPESIGYYFSGYLGYFVLGYYLKNYGIGLKTSTFLFLLFISAMGLMKLTAPEINLYTSSWYLSIFCAVSVVFYWNLIKYISPRILLSDHSKKRLILFSNLVFGIYFVHIGIVRYLMPWVDDCITHELSFILKYSLMVCLSFTLSLLLSYLISCLPYAEYIIGFSLKRQHTDSLILEN